MPHKGNVDEGMKGRRRILFCFIKYHSGRGELLAISRPTDSSRASFDPLPRVDASQSLSVVVDWDFCAAPPR